MDEGDWLAPRGGGQGGRRRAGGVRRRGGRGGGACGIPGSASEADDAVQEAWLRLSRADAGAVDNLGGWLTTVVARGGPNMLQARSARRGGPGGGGARPS